jgi:hypothetical protein
MHLGPVHLGFVASARDTVVEPAEVPMKWTIALRPATAGVLFAAPGNVTNSDTPAPVGRHGGPA